MTPIEDPEDLAIAVLIEAAQHADWTQVALNGGPPCFYLEDNYGLFCLRAKRWHDGNADPHEFVSLADLLRDLTQAKGGL